MTEAKISWFTLSVQKNGLVVAMMLNLRWTVDDAQVAGCPVAMVADNKPAIVFGTSTGYIVAVDGRGQERWRTKIGCRVSAWPTVDDSCRPAPSILAADESGLLACLESYGEVRWIRDLEGSLTSFNNACCVRGGRETSFVATDRAGCATGLDNDGAIVWRFHAHDAGLGPAAVGDIDGDGADEIVFSAGDRHIYCLDSDGGLRWAVECKGTAMYSAPVLGDIGAGACVLAGAGDDLIRCISPAGEVLWTQRGVGAGSIEVDLSLADIDGDGVDELVYAHTGRAIQALNRRGRIIWSTAYSGGDQPFGPSAGDVNGDGWPELLLTQRSGPTLRVLDRTGALMEEHDLPGGMVGAPVIADIDGDGLLEVLAVAHRTGQLRCYGTLSPVGSPVPWPTSRGPFDGRGNRLLGRYKRIRARRVKTEGVRIRPEVFGKWALGRVRVGYLSRGSISACPVQITLTGPDGIAHRSALSARMPSVDLEVLSTGTHLVRVQATDGRTGRILAGCESRVNMSLFEDERSEARQLLASLAQSVADGEESAALLRRRQMAWSEIESRMGHYDGLSNALRRQLISEVRAMLGSLRRLARCTEFARKSGCQGGSAAFIPWIPEHPWACFEPETGAPSGMPIRELILCTDRRAHDASVIELANLLDRPVTVRVWLENLRSDGNDCVAVDDHLVLRQVVWVPTASGTMGADALADLGNAGLVQLPPSANARLWIDVCTGGLAPGMYRTTLHMRALVPGMYRTTLHMRALVPADATWDIPISWTVAGVSLPTVMPLRFCNWGYVNSSPLRDLADAAVKDMQDHHTNVFVLTGDWAPRAVYDRTGRLTEVDWQKHDWILDRLREQDMFLFPGSPVVPAEGCPSVGTPEWEKAFEAFLPVWVQHLSTKGFGYDRWALYPVDEPGLLGGKLIDDLERYARFYKRVDPRVQVYTDPFKGMTVADMKRVLNVVDIFQPNFGTVVSEPSHERIDFLRMTGKAIWTYEAAGRVKEMIGIAYYWSLIWSAWELGLTGIGFWSYCTRPYDLWQGPNPNGNDWEMVYQGSQHPVPSVRWQAIRIGIEDYARLWRLSRAISRARAMGRKAHATKAERTLRKLVQRAHDAQWNPAVVAGIRRALIDLACQLLDIPETQKVGPDASVKELEQGC